jgi:hypothetical protein
VTLGSREPENALDGRRDPVERISNGRSASATGTPFTTPPINGEPNAATNAFDNIPGVDEDPK